MKPNNKLITPNSFSADKLIVGDVVEKTSRGGITYQNAPITYAGGKARVLLKGVFQISDFAEKKYGSGLSLVLLFNEGKESEKNKALFDKLEAALNLDEVSLGTGDRIYMKLYEKVKFWKMIFNKAEGRGKRRLLKPADIIGVKFVGHVVFRLDNIFMGNKRGKPVPQSIISVVEEVLFEAKFEEESFFDYIVVEINSDEEEEGVIPDEEEELKELYGL